MTEPSCSEKPRIRPTARRGRSAVRRSRADYQAWRSDIMIALLVWLRPKLLATMLLRGTGGDKLGL